MFRHIVSAGPPSGPVMGNSLGGREFFFDTTWSFWTDAIGDEIYISIDPSNSFSNASLASSYEEISIKVDTFWIIVPQWYWYPCCTPAPTVNGYCW